MGTLIRWISIRRFTGTPLRSLLVVFGIALGVAMLVATAAVNRSIHTAFVDAVGRVIGKSDLVVSGGEIGIPAELLEEIADVEGVAHVAPVLQITTRIASGGALLILGVDLLGDRHFLPFTDAGGDDLLEDPLELINDPRGILVSKRLAEQSALPVGGTIRILTPDGAEDFHVRGILVDEGPAASYGGQVAVMYLDGAQASFGRADRLDRIDVAVAAGQSITDVENRIRSIVGERGSVEEPGGRTRRLAAILRPLEVGVQVTGFIALLVGMLLIYNTVSIAVAQRRREVGILRAVGATKQSVVALFVLEALVLATPGSLIGLAIAGPIAQVALAKATPNVSQFYLPIRPEQPSVDLELALAGLALGLLAALFASWWPARRAASIDPIDAMRRVRDRRGDDGVPHRAMLACGLALSLPAVVFASLGTLWSGLAAIAVIVAGALLCAPAFVRLFGALARRIADACFGVPGVLAVDNVLRSLGRSALTVAALTVSVGSAVCIGSWARSLEVSLITWIDQTIPADLSVTCGSPLADQQNVPFRADTIAQLEKIDGVREILPVRIASQEIGGWRFQLVSQPAVAFFAALSAKGLALQVIDGEPLAGRELEATPSVILSENAARRLGVKSGDAVEMPTPTGMKRLPVRAVIVDYTSDVGMAFIDRKWFTQYFQDDLVDTADLYLDPGADTDAVAAAVRAQLGGYGSIFVSSSADLRREVRRIVVDAVAVTRSTDLVATIVALLGVVGMMLATVFDRIREIGLLRAIGATRRQIAIALVVESSFLGMAAALLGIMASIPMGLTFIHVVALDATGWRLDYHFPWHVAVEVGLLVATTAALAGVLPGRAAAQIDVKDALSYE